MTEPRDRRAALKTLTLVGGAALGCAVVGPAARFLLGPGELAKARAGKGLWVKTVKLADLREGEPKRVTIVADARDGWVVARNQELGAAFLVRKGAEVVAISVECPHLGCSVQAKEKGEFYCPCHDSSFSAEGARQHGPSPRDLDRLATKVEDGHVLIDFRRFKLGVPERVEV